MTSTLQEGVSEDCNRHCHWICSDGIHWILCQAHPHSHQQHHRRILNFKLAFCDLFCDQIGQDLNVTQYYNLSEVVCKDKRMLDLFSIFSKGGILLWCFKGAGLLPKEWEAFTPTINELIRSVLLQERAVKKNFWECGQLAVKYKMVIIIMCYIFA